MKSHLTYDTYKWAMLHWYKLLKKSTHRQTPVQNLMLALPAGGISAVSWTLLTLADTVESVALTLFNIITGQFKDSFLSLGRALLSGVFILTIPVIAPALFLKSIFMMIFEPINFPENSYHLFHRAVYLKPRRH